MEPHDGVRAGAEHIGFSLDASMQLIAKQLNISRLSVRPLIARAASWSRIAGSASIHSLDHILMKVASVWHE